MGSRRSLNLVVVGVVGSFYQISKSFIRLFFFSHCFMSHLAFVRLVVVVVGSFYQISKSFIRFVFFSNCFMSHLAFVRRAECKQTKKMMSS